MSDLAAHADDILNEAEARPVVLTQPYEPNCIVYSDHAADVHDSALRITGALLTLLEMDDSGVGESLPRIFDRAEALSPTNHEACVTELCAAAAKDDWLLLVSDYNAWSETALARAAGLDGSVDDILDDCPLVPRP